MVRAIVHYSGTVQGVGFRYTAVHIARQFPRVSGTVRNLPDGRVELIAEGPEADLSDFLQRLERTMEGYIRSKRVTRAPATGEFRDFRITY